MMPIFRVINKTERYQLWQLQSDDNDQGRLSESLINDTQIFKETLLKHERMNKCRADRNEGQLLSNPKHVLGEISGSFWPFSSHFTL